MTPIDQMNDTPVNDTDIEMLVRVAIKLLNELGGIQLMQEALETSGDPVQVVGQFLGQLIVRLGEDVAQKMDLDPRSLFARGGVLEELLDYLEPKLGLPPEFSDEVYNEVVELVKAMAMGGQQAAPAAPQGAPMAPPQGPGIQGMMGGM